MAKPHFQVYTRLTLYTTDERFYLEPENGSEVLVIDRISDSIHHEVNHGQTNDLQSTSRQVHGIVGVIKLIAGSYLIVITKTHQLGKIDGQSIYRIEETEMLSFRKTTTHLTENQIRYNNTYLSMVQHVLNTSYIYFSYMYDLSHSMQRLHLSGPDFLKRSFLERADHRFVWNRSLLKRFEDKEFHRYCLPIVHGFISSNTVAINDQQLTLTLISRRSVQRAGTRLFMRGANHQGHVANFVETEQILELPNSKSSFVQVRGSIPLIWNQYPNIKYKPRPQLSLAHNQQEVFQKHIEQLLSVYGRVSMINLINQKGQELILGQELSTLVSQFCQQSNLLRYEPFDFHAECGQGRWDKLSKLTARIIPDQQEMGYFLMLKEGNVLNVQDGIFRTNCIDSLDRTNVVQNLIAKANLETHLTKFGVFQGGQKIEDYPHLDGVYRNVWADNADFCSVQYAGTGALKTDFTRTGKRSFLGLMRDGFNSMIRYYKNNFNDGFRQDAIDLFLGNYLVHENEGTSVRCPLEERRDWKYSALPLFCLFSTSMFFLSILIPPEHSTETFMYLLFWSGMIVFTGSMIVYHGGEYVDVPKLTASRETRMQSNSFS